MNDSASSYNDWSLHSGQTPHKATHASHVIAVASGKGGVGKTNITTNLGIALSTRGYKVCIFDADTSLANINILLGLRPEFTLEHFLEDQKSLEDIMAEGPRGLRVIPAASGIADYANLSAEKQQKLNKALAQLEQSYDYLLIDTAAGIGNSVLSFAQAAQYNIIVISPEPTSLTDAFSLIKVLTRQETTRPVYIVVNMVLDYGNSLDVFSRFEKAVKKYIKIDVHYLGYVALDESIIASVRLQQPVLTAKPDSPASRCFHALAKSLSLQLDDPKETHRFSNFWKKRANSEAEENPQQAALKGLHEQAKGVAIECDTLAREWARYPERHQLNSQLQEKLRSLRNSASATGLSEAVELCMQLEHRLKELERHERNPGGRFINVITAILDYVQDMLNQEPGREDDSRHSGEDMAALLQELQQAQTLDDMLNDNSAEPPPSSSSETTTESIRTDGPETADIDHLAKQILEWMNSGAAAPAEQKTLIQKLANTYIDQYGELPFELRASLYRTLEQQDFPFTEIRDMALTLEGLYEKQQQRPLRNTEDSLLKLLEDTHGDEEKFLRLFTQLQSSYQRQFGRAPAPLQAATQNEHDNTLTEQELRNRITLGHYSDEEFGELLSSLKKSYQEHSGKPYLDEKDRILSRTMKMISQISAQEASLREGLGNIPYYFQEEETDRANEP